MKAEQCREMSLDELEDRLSELEKQIFELRSQAVTETLENNKAIRNIKRDIARIKTVIHEKKLNSAEKKYAAKKNKN